MFRWRRLDFEWVPRVRRHLWQSRRGKFLRRNTFCCWNSGMEVEFAARWMDGGEFSTLLFSGLSFMQMNESVLIGFIYILYILNEARFQTHQPLAAAKRFRRHEAAERFPTQKSHTSSIRGPSSCPLHSPAYSSGESLGRVVVGQLVRQAEYASCFWYYQQRANQRRKYEADW